jgi:hypothetical protein
MKKLFLLAATLVAALTFEASASAATITFSSPGVVNGSFDVLVRAENVFAGRAPSDFLLSFGFDVAVTDPTVLQYVGATSGPLFDPATNAFGPDVFAQATALPGIAPGVAEPLLLATLHFNTIGVGPASILITSDLSDFFQGLQFLNDPFQESIAGRVDVRAAAPVPEPTTLVLSSIGLLGLATARRIRGRA